MAVENRGELRKPLILTAVVTIIAAPILSADTSAAVTVCVYVALICSFAWWTRYFFKRKKGRTQANAATYYQRGLEAKEARDYEAAMQWFTVSANVGDAGAMNDIGLLHLDGLGVAKNDALAVEWFQKALAHGDTKNAPANIRRALAEMQGDQRRQGSGNSRAEDNGRMTRAAALEVFDLKEGATPADIRAAYLRLMQQVHPDRGGSTFFAKQLNEARDLLLAD
jgi:TPR repeat protein